MRIGIGYDVHRLVRNRRLILGGVEIPFEQGLLGHSDADVLLHAICDALFGAMALGDIGQHFSNVDEQFRDISSLILLQKTKEILIQHHFGIENVDTTILAEKPNLAPFIPAMKKNIVNILEISEDKMSIKATTTEGLGFVGRGEGIAVQAVVMINDVHVL